MQYRYEKIRAGLFEVYRSDGRAVGRIRHVMSPRVGWESSDGGFYATAKDAAEALVGKTAAAA